MGGLCWSQSRQAIGGAGPAGKIALKVVRRHCPRMRVLLFVLAAALSACAAPIADVAPSPRVSAPAAEPDTLSLLQRAGRADAPTVEQIERRFGPADIARRDGAGAMLTYRLPDCALALLFAADGNNRMRLREAQPGPRHAGQSAPSLEACAAEAQARPTS